MMYSSSAHAQAFDRDATPFDRWYTVFGRSPRLLMLVFHQSRPDGIPSVGAVVVAPVAISVDVQRVRRAVVGVAVRRAEPPVGGRNESHPNTRRAPPPCILIDWPPLLERLFY